MDKAALIQKMEECVSSLREQLDKNEGSTITTIINSAKLGFESLKATIMGNETAKNALESFKSHVGDFEKALKEGDKSLSAKALETMENAIQDLKNKD